jgi:hypothetical protein
MHSELAVVEVDSSLYNPQFCGKNWQILVRISISMSKKMKKKMSTFAQHKSSNMEQQHCQRWILPCCTWAALAHGTWAFGKE